MSLLRGDAVTLVRGGRTLFERLDFAVERGGALHVTGPNASGKSSLIRLIAGLLRPSAGRLERANAALADEGLSLDIELPLRRALEFWGGPRLGQAMAAFDLHRLSDVPVRLLSTGQAKRAQLARVMASDAPLWLLDEPANGLDSAGIAELTDAIAVHRGAGGAVVAASHLRLAGEWRELAL